MEIKGKTFYILPSMMMVEKELENFDNEFNFCKKKKNLCKQIRKLRLFFC